MDTSNFMRIHHKTNKQIKYGTNVFSFCITNPSVAEFAAHLVRMVLQHLPIKKLTPALTNNNLTNDFFFALGVVRDNQQRHIWLFQTLDSCKVRCWAIPMAFVWHSNYQSALQTLIAWSFAFVIEGLWTLTYKVSSITDSEILILILNLWLFYVVSCLLIK